MTAISTSLEIIPKPDEKLANGSRRLARLLHLDIVACSRNDADAGAGDALTEEARVLRGRELILLATDHERGRRHGRDPAGAHPRDLLRGGSGQAPQVPALDRKSTRRNSRHSQTSHGGF